MHALLREDEDVRAALVERFGPEVIDANGEVDRAAIAETVFKDRAALEWLEALLHPRVIQEYMAWREQLAGAAASARALRDRGARSSTSPAARRASTTSS